MPVFEGIIDPGGNIVRNRGDFEVVSKGNDLLVVDFDQDVSGAFVLATAWRGDGDFGPVPVSAGPQPAKNEYYLFAVKDSMGVSFRLDNDEPFADGATSMAGSLETRDWYAWNNLMPPPPDDFHIVGEVYVPNPGIEPMLTFRTPQGINPQHILLDLYFRQIPGTWPQVFTWKPVRYDRRLAGRQYAVAEVFYQGNPLVHIDVEDIV